VAGDLSSYDSVSRRAGDLLKWWLGGPSSSGWSAPTGTAPFTRGSGYNAPPPHPPSNGSFHYWSPWDAGGLNQLIVPLSITWLCGYDVILILRHLGGIITRLIKYIETNLLIQTTLTYFQCFLVRLHFGFNLCNCNNDLIELKLEPLLFNYIHLNATNKKKVIINCPN